jgi:polyvinyl alcohol dehydrogenase (cytochrome)
MRRHWGVCVVGVLLAATMACSGDDSDSGGGGASGAGDDGGGGSSAEAEVPVEWAMLGADLANSRAATGEDAVGPDNVADLQPAWELTGAQGITGTPVIADGVVYIADWTGKVHALDAATGDEEWSAQAGGYYIGGSVALDDERVFVGAFDANVIALDRSTGDELWKTPIGDHPMAVIFGSPIYVDGLVLVGVASFELMTGNAAPTFRGHLVALDAETGEEVWRWWATEADDTAGPGVSIWSSPAVDTERGTVYIGTGNTYTPPPAPKADALVALGLETGEEQWVTQFTEGDTWTLTAPAGSDSDVGAPPNLFTVGDTDAAGVADKAGVYHAVDRETGEVLWETELTEGGLQGGVLAGAAVAEGSVFVASNRASTDADLVALAADTGEVEWRLDLEGHVSGPVSWANDVVYVSDDTGRIAGYSAETGERLWSHAVDASAAGGIAVVDGTVYAGWGWWFSSAPEDPQGGLIAFRLDGEAAPGDDGSDSESAAVSGEDVYAENCSRCHGGSGQGGSGPPMEGVVYRLTEAEHLEIVQEGRNSMPAWKDILTEDEIAAVVAYEREVLSGGD